MYSKAENTADNYNTPSGYRPAEAYGAVIEDLRADGFVQRLFNVPDSGPDTYQLPENYVLYIIGGNRTKVYLPQNPKTGQTVKVIKTGGSDKKVYAKLPI